MSRVGFVQCHSTEIAVYIFLPLMKLKIYSSNEVASVGPWIDGYMGCEPTHLRPLIMGREPAGMANLAILVLMQS